MTRLVYLIGLSALFNVCAFAEDKWWFEGDAFFGYSFLRFNSAQQIPAFTANGGVGTIAENLTKHIGFEGEFSSYHNGNVNNSQFNTTTFGYMYGPRISYGRTKKYDPYVHALFGGLYATSSIAVKPAALLPPVHYSSTQNTFAMAFGGGIDIKLTRYILVRPVQIDYFFSRFATPTISVDGQLGQWTGKNQNNVRFAAGFVFNINARD